MRKKIEQFFKKRAATQWEMVRLSIFIIGSLMALLGLPLQPLIGILHADLIIMSAVMWCFVLLWMVLFLLGKLPLNTSFSASVLCSQTITSLRIIVLAATAYKGCDMSIIINEIISFSVLLLSSMAMIRQSTINVWIISVVGMVAAYVINPAVVRVQTMVLIIFLETFLLGYALIVHQVVKSTKAKFYKYKDQQTSIMLDMFNMSHVEMTALMQLSRDKSQYSQMNKDIVEKLTEQTQRNIIKLGQYLSADKRDKRIDIGHIFPDLSLTEQEVCRLVLKGYTLKEIATAMNKSTSNISTVRGNIRKKLGLEKEDDLKSFLRSATAGY
ncbi:MAG: helix-turn-helix transcriptional regulator [Prevotella sp.]|nr:helix-turn-helix transcriptional regulator [Prevotella sp.]